MIDWQNVIASLRLHILRDEGKNGQTNEVAVTGK